MVKKKYNIKDKIIFIGQIRGKIYFVNGKIISKVIYCGNLEKRTYTSWFISL